ncbi:uncharacterized protein RCC_04234 [Ramularia collo-cygni]|uniref:KANL3/Tex30 alpha/beta hydrolase-like domain-containing protein n=1 Tax=Ramularia collo-cygni TaxID=112498 RepID=A0A2D3UYV8_9PEZI|nr:uncharacterized protein RCC_04234 [Ramularia collo-cygni]CZT18390.1 uncharacterized protein RCC_04234 [Ramularia collo-cygni]
MPKRTRAEVAAANREGEEREQENDEENTSQRDENANIKTFTIPFKKDKTISCETREYSPSTSQSLIFTHGAGGGLESAAMRSFAAGFSRHGRITSFQGNMNLSSRVGMFQTVVSHHQEKHENDPLVLGGRSMGARAAVLAALELISEGVEVQALVLVSYPLTASKNGKQEREFERREKILLDLPESLHVLFVCGTKDVQCDLEALEEVRNEMRANSWMVEVRDADHGMGVVLKAGTRAVGEMTGEVAARWLAERDREKRVCEIHWDKEEEKACQESWRNCVVDKGDKADVNEKKMKTG